MNERPDFILDDEAPFHSPEAHASYLARVQAYCEERQELARRLEAARIKQAWPPIEDQADYDMYGSYQNYEWSE